MANENKQLLLKDLCTRLPYGVKLHIEFYDLQGDGKLASRDIKLTTGNIGYCFGNSHWASVKPYLRPMSSMTFKETREFLSVKNNGEGEYLLTVDKQDWLNKNHFDYRGLIPMGLALEAPEDMYKTE